MSMVDDRDSKAVDFPESKPEKESHGESIAPSSSDTHGSQDSEQAEEIPAEILNALPPEMRQVFSARMALVHSAPSRQSPLAKNITPQHISTILANSDNDSRREFDLKRLAMVAVLVLVAMILVYAAKTKDKDLSEKILVAGIAAVGGAGVGYGVGRGSRD
jgi:Na+/pantothenate symporter